MARLRAVFLWVLVGAMAALAPAHAQRSEAPEATVKAAFLYKFAGYVEWDPAAFASADAPFVLAVMAADDVAADLKGILAGRSVAGHPVILKRVKEGETLRGVHLLFVGREQQRLPAILRAARAEGVLAVTENERGLEQGAAINFVVSADRVGFEVSLDSAEKSGHRISSRMLTVARRVIPKAT